MSLDDPAVVRREYASERGLTGRIAAYRYAEGPDAQRLALDAVAEVSPRRVLEVGCGTGVLAELIAREVGAEVVALDQSERMVELTRARGIEAHVGDAADLPFIDGAFDCAVAAWMLYHVIDVPCALAELARVLRPEGRLVAVTNSVEHLRELADLLGVVRPAYPFSAENGEELLRVAFAHVERRDAYGYLVFPNRAKAQAYVDASIVWQGGSLPPFDGPLRVSRAPTVFVADR